MWTCKTFSELSLAELYELLKLRQEVFVVEQTCPYLDADGKDVDALHLWSSDEQGMTAYARIFLPSAAEPYARIGRVITVARARGLGLGQELMRAAIGLCNGRAPDAPIRLGAQVYLKRFYRGFGFVEIGEEYLEDDIPHVDMERPATTDLGSHEH